jgi:translation elongation factor EF-G
VPLSDENNSTILESNNPRASNWYHIEPKLSADVDKMGMVEAKEWRRRSYVYVRTDEAQGQTIISVWVSFHLDILVDRT